MGTTIGVGGPPLTLVYQRSSGSEIRGTLAPIQSFGAATSLAALAVVGELEMRDLGRGLLLAPGMVIGFAVSGWVGAPHQALRSTPRGAGVRGGLSHRHPGPGRRPSLQTRWRYSAAIGRLVGGACG